MTPQIVECSLLPHSHRQNFKVSETIATVNRKTPKYAPSWRQLKPKFYRKQEKALKFIALLLIFHWYWRLKQQMNDYNATKWLGFFVAYFVIFNVIGLKKMRRSDNARIWRRSRHQLRTITVNHRWGLRADRIRM